MGLPGLEPGTKRFSYPYVSIRAGLYHHPQHYLLGCRALLWYYCGRLHNPLVSAPFSQDRDWLGSGLPYCSCNLGFPEFTRFFNQHFCWKSPSRMSRSLYRLSYRPGKGSDPLAGRTSTDRLATPPCATQPASRH